MFTFDKLNKQFTSVDKVPAVAEFMPSRYVYEGLIVHQYKHNNFKKNFFDIELLESKSDFKQVHYIPELRQILNECSMHLIDGLPLTDKTYVNNLELITNEVSKELMRVPELKFEMTDKITPNGFNPQVAAALDAYLNDLLIHYRNIFTKANSLKDRFISSNLDQDAARFNRIKDVYFNESVSSIVRKDFEKNKILRQGNHLVQMVDPIYQIPEPAGPLSFRTHFFAPLKHLGGHFFETLWFNLTLVWILTSFLYAVLYYDLLKKGLKTLGSIKWRKK